MVLKEFRIDQFMILMQSDEEFEEEGWVGAIDR